MTNFSTQGIFYCIDIDEDIYHIIYCTVSDIIIYMWYYIVQEYCIYIIYGIVIEMVSYILCNISYHRTLHMKPSSVFSTFISSFPVFYLQLIPFHVFHL